MFTFILSYLLFTLSSFNINITDPAFIVGSLCNCSLSVANNDIIASAFLHFAIPHIS